MHRNSNVGVADQMIRFAVGLAAVLLAAFAFHGALAVVAWIVGLIALGTAATRVCPAYFLFGVRTCPPQEQGR